jgi:hypothetical protein
MPPASAFRHSATQLDTGAFRYRTGFPYSGGLVPASVKMYGGGKRTTLDVYTAGGVESFTLHVQTAGGGQGYTQHGHTASGRKGYT